MRDQDDYWRLYEQQKQQGRPFWPYILFKDAVVALAILLVLYTLAATAGASLGPEANPDVATENPRPEWYFLWFFQALKYFPGWIEGAVVVGIPLLVIGLLTILPFIDRGADRHIRNRPVVLVGTATFVVAFAVLTVLSLGEGAIAEGGEAAELASSEVEGAELFAGNCAVCHGEFGEGGPNPVDLGDILAPISTGEYLATHTDDTIGAIVTNGQPALGMAPFGIAYGGPLQPQEIDSIVTFIRSWEADPPVELPSEIAIDDAGFSADAVFSGVCSSCHGIAGEGTDIGPSLIDPAFQDRTTDEEMFDTINLGHDATAMVAWGDILPARHIQELVLHIRGLTTSETTTEPALSFATDIQPIFEASCAACHGSAGGWDASSYDTVLNSGDHGPAIVAGDANSSLLAQKMSGTHTEGTVMPPSGPLPADLVQRVIDWIDSGADP